MRYKLNKSEYNPGESEQIETTIVLEKETRSVIHGVVLDADKQPLQDAVVKLFEMSGKGTSCNLNPITHTFTDECGSFLFGPLPAKKHYVIKIWHDAVLMKQS